MLKVVGASWEKTRLTSIMLTIVVVIAIFAIFFIEFPTDHNDGNYAATVYWGRHGYSLKFWGQGNILEHINPGVVRAYYKPKMKETGWATLEIQSQSSFPDFVQAHAAGLVEGSLTWQLIFWHWQNSVAYPCESRREFCYKARNYLTEASDKMKSLANKYHDKDPLWHQVNLFFHQLEGLEIGWRYGVTRSRKNKEIDIPHIDFLLMNSVSDLRDLEFKFNITTESDFRSSPLTVSILKLLPNSTEKFVMAHASSGYFTDMLRVQKKYSFGFHLTSDNQNDLVPGQSIEFTSYPAAIHSQDDFYHVIGDKKFIITGTALRNYNESLWNETDTSKLLLGPRIMAANRLSNNGSEWGKILEKGNGGTGIKQWLFIDPGEKNIDIWLTEQIPGQTVTQSHTHVLEEKGYWASYGLPYNKEILDLIDYKVAAQESDINTFFCMVESTLHEGQKNVTDTNSMIDLMRSNDMAVFGRSDVRHSDISSIQKNNCNFANTFNNKNNSGNGNHSGMFNYNTNPDVSDNRLPNHSTIPAPKEGLSLFEKFKIFLDMEMKGQVVKSDYETEENKLSAAEFKQQIESLRRSLNGNIDLKLTSGTENFRAAAGPPFTEINGIYKVAPFQWSKSMFRELPHHGQADAWKFQPLKPNWVW